MKLKLNRRDRYPVFLSQRFLKRRKVWRGMFCLTLLSLTTATGVHWANRLIYQRQRSLTQPFLRMLNVEDLGERVAIIAPHPDDETLACGGLMNQLRKQRLTPHVLIVTNGDNFNFAIQITLHNLRINESDRETFSKMRQSETLKAMVTLGVPVENVKFLGLSERSLPTKWLINCDPSPMSLIINWLTEIQPSSVFIPSRFDDHPIHATVSSLAWSALLQAKSEGKLIRQTRVFEFLIHYGSFPKPQGLHQDLELIPPKDLLNRASWYQFPVPEPVRRLKAEAIACYKTQLPLMGRFLKSFIRCNELFTEPFVLWAQPDRSHEIRSILPGADLIEVKTYPLEAKFFVSLKGKPAKFIRCGAQIFIPTAKRPIIETIMMEDFNGFVQVNEKNLSFSVKGSKMLKSPFVFTPFTLYRDSFCDIAPLIVPKQASVFGFQ